jgi:diadenosine tetraphosphatase ApaH/serine/threonine PP2A family protein phosphatase
MAFHLPSPMRYAVLGDVHGNLEALTAVMDHLAAQRAERYFCVGDVVGYGADPAACLDYLQQAGALIIGGNHDLASIGKLEVNWFNDAARAALLWTRDQLSFADLDAIRRLPLTATEEPFTLVHGTLRHPQRFDYLIDAAQAIETLSICRTLFCLVGHTHWPCVIEYQRAARRVTKVLTKPEELSEVPFTHDEEAVRYLVNPGSVGQPRDGDPRASCAVIDTEQKRIAIHRVTYDIPTAQQKIRAAHLPEFLADRLAVGR